MIDVLLCGEGVTDYGSEKYQDGEYVRKDGVIQILMRKCVGDAELVFHVKTRQDIKRFSLLRKGTNKSESTAIKLAAIARRENCRHVVWHRDEDNRGYAEMVAQVEEYFTAAKEKGMKCLAAVPVHMTESWLLADARAFPRKPTNPALPPKPEAVWGKPGSEKHPKRYLERVLTQFRMESNAAEMAEIAAKVDVEELMKKCPVSFGRFAEDMRDFVRE